MWLAVAALGVIGAAIYFSIRAGITSFPTMEVDDPKNNPETRDYLSREGA